MDDNNILNDKNLDKEKLKELEKLFKKSCFYFYINNFICITNNMLSYKYA